MFLQSCVETVGAGRSVGRKAKGGEGGEGGETVKRRWNPF